MRNRLGLFAAVAMLGATLPARRSDDARLSPHPKPEPDPVRDWKPAPTSAEYAADIATVARAEKRERQEARARAAAIPIVETRQMRRARERKVEKMERRR